MRIEAITVKNYRLFEELTCTFNPRLTVIVANNGGGKTAILDAIRVSFGTYLGAFPTVSGNAIKLVDVRQEKVRDEPVIGMEYVFPSQVRASGRLGNQDKNISWLRALNTAKSGTTIKDAKALTVYARLLQNAEASSGDKVDWPLLAYYGTGRLWLHKKLTSNKSFAAGFHSRAAGYIDCMDTASSYKFFAEWFGYAYRAITQSKIRFMEAHPSATPQEVIAHESAFSPLVAAVQDAVEIVLTPSGWKHLWYSETVQDVTAVHDQYGRLALGQLSDGIRNCIALVADIAFRAVQLNPRLGARAAKETQGIVLIDEIDMHLHPSWQQTVLTDLMTAFPKLQFIVTTHSPQVLTTVPSESIRVLREGKIFAASPGTEGAESSRLLKRVFGVESRPPHNPATKKLNDYLALVYANKWDALRAKRLRKLLDARYRGEEPALTAADLHIENQKWEQESGLGGSVENHS